MVTLLVMVVLAYSGLCALVFVLQEKLLFIPRPTDPYALSALQPWQRTITSSGIQISGWIIPAAKPANAPLLFYYGGNAEDISLNGIETSTRIDANVVLMNYRGYGASEGAPTQAALFTDALHIHDELINTTTHNGNIVAFGRSLGSGIAVYLATHRRVDAIVLVTPYDSIRDVARRHYAWLPVSALIRHPFDSLSLAPGLAVPALFIVAEHDEVIPPVHAQNLADHWGGKVQWLSIAGATHNSIGSSTEYWSSITNFLRGL